MLLAWPNDRFFSSQQRRNKVRFTFGKYIILCIGFDVWTKKELKNLALAFGSISYTMPMLPFKVNSFPLLSFLHLIRFYLIVLFTWLFPFPYRNWANKIIRHDLVPLIEFHVSIRLVFGSQVSMLTAYCSQM